jgi:hypothetical protein
MRFSGYYRSLREATGELPLYDIDSSTAPDAITRDQGLNITRPTSIKTMEIPFIMLEVKAYPR